MKYIKNNILETVIIISGILLRFYSQFIHWAFNSDEVAIGTNIIKKSFIELLYPLDSFQSAPPLFLWSEKLFSFLGPNYISLKIISFVCSVASLLLFNRLVKRHYTQVIHLFLLVIFAYNPFVMYNSLTLKQYTLDLAMGLIAVNYFLDQKSQFKNYLFFAVWCIISNTGLFFCVGFIAWNLYKMFAELKTDTLSNLTKKYIAITLPYFAAPLLYIVYFIWFMRQPGAKELKAFMVNYWHPSFPPLNSGIFLWTANQIKDLYIFFFTSYGIIGIPLLLIFFIGFFSSILKIKRKHNELMTKCIGVYLFSIITHILLSILHLYPFSSRLYVYIAPFIYFVFAEGLIVIFNYIEKAGYFAKLPLTKYVPYAFMVLLTGLYATYFSYNENDVLSLMNKLSQVEHSEVAMTGKAMPGIINWINFTEYKTKEFNEEFSKIKLFNPNDSVQNKKIDYIISRQHHKFGHFQKNANPEKEITALLNSNRIEKKYLVNGYTVYKFTKKD
jgi:hypothetical protein